MTLTKEERDTIVAYRIEKAKETFQEAKGIISLGYWNAVANRLYYSCFYMGSALLIQNGYQPHTHKGVLGLLGNHFVRTAIIPKELSKAYQKLFELRQAGDYSDFIEVGEEDVILLLPETEEFIEFIEQLINKKSPDIL